MALQMTISLQKTFKAGNTQQESTIKHLLEDTFYSIKDWMDKMQLNLNLDKMEYMLFGLKQQLKKVAQEPIMAEPDLMTLSNKVKYLGGVLDNTLNFEAHISLKLQKAMTNFTKIKSLHKVHHCRSLHHIGTNALHFTLGLQ